MKAEMIRQTHDTAVKHMGKNAIGVFNTLKNCKPAKIVAASSVCPLKP